MEYSVNDLIKVLLRKWYVIVITMCIVTGAAFLLSNLSYRNAVENYEAYTTQMETSVIEKDMAKASYRVFYALEDVDRFQIDVPLEGREYFAQQYLGNDEELKATDYDNAIAAYVTAYKVFDELLGNEEPIIVSDHSEISRVTEWEIQIVSYADGEANVKNAVEESIAYLQSRANEDNLQLQFTEIYYEYTPYTRSFTQSAVFAQMIMKQPPEAPPSPLRVLATAAIYSFAFACFGVLIAKFIKDTAPKKEKAHKEK